MEGINSSKAWEIDIESKNTAKTSGGYEYKRNGDTEKTNAPAVFTWIPGIKPVITPPKTPIIHASMRSNNEIHYHSFY